MQACVRTELLVSMSLVVLRIVTLFSLYLFQVSSPGRNPDMFTVDDFWQHH